MRVVILHGYSFNVNDSGVIYDQDGKAELKTYNKKPFNYQIVRVPKMRPLKFIFVHKIVCLAFHPNPDNKPYINHIDGIKYNNHPSNLEWCTPKENYDHSINVLGNNPPPPKDRQAIIQMDLQGNFIAEHESLDSAVKNTGVNQGSLSNVLNGKRGMTMTGGFKWKRK